MRSGFFSHFAVDSLRKNRRYYLPYALTCSLIQGMLYIISALSDHPGLSSMQGGATLSQFLMFGVWVIVIFAVIFLFYTYSFLMRQRKSEFGLYHVLGMEKRHIVRIVGMETLILGAGSALVGLLFGVLLNKLVLLGLVRLLGEAIPLGFRVSLRGMEFTVLVFALIHLALFLVSALQIARSTAVSLLQSGQVGEREPKARLIPALLGLLALGVGYVISLVTTRPQEAIPLFFLAVILVVVGTYLLFLAGSVTWLKLMKHNRRYYYQTRHFINISGLLYRMKQNAAGLASICILSTMVLVMISGTTSLYLGVQERVALMYPRQANLEIFMGGTGVGDYDLPPEQLKTLLAQQGIESDRPLYFRTVEYRAEQNGVDFFPSSSDQAPYKVSVACLEDYNRLSGTNLTLAPGEVFVYGLPSGAGQISLSGRSYTVAGLLDDLAAQTMFVNTSIYIRVGVILPSQAELSAFYDELWSHSDSKHDALRTYFCFDLPGAGAELSQAELEVRAMSALGEGWSTSLEYGGVMFSLYEREGLDYVAAFAGLFFVGIFLAILFVTATILIIYYKQISEGLQDAKRFEIMQKVGLSRLEIRKSIRSQVMTVFFLPLLTAGIHCAFSFPIINRMLAILSMNNTTGFLLCMVLCFLAFALLYVVVYTVTARTYYRIVSGTDAR